MYAWRASAPPSPHAVEPLQRPKPMFQCQALSSSDLCEREARKHKVGSKQGLLLWGTPFAGPNRLPNVELRGRAPYMSSTATPHGRVRLRPFCEVGDIVAASCPVDPDNLSDAVQAATQEEATEARRPVPIDPRTSAVWRGSSVAAEAGAAKPHGVQESVPSKWLCASRPGCCQASLEEASKGSHWHVL